MNGDESWPGYDNLVYVYRSNVEFIFDVMNVYVVNLVHFIYTTEELYLQYWWSYMHLLPDCRYIAASFYCQLEGINWVWMDEYFL